VKAEEPGTGNGERFCRGGENWSRFFRKGRFSFQGGGRENLDVGVEKKKHDALFRMKKVSSPSFLENKKWGLVSRKGKVTQE